MKRREREGELDKEGHARCMGVHGSSLQAVEGNDATIKGKEDVMKKFMMVVLASVLGVIFVSGISLAAPVVMRIGETHPQDYPTTKGDYEFARLVKERTNGRIVVEVFHSKQLGEEKAVIEPVLTSLTAHLDQLSVDEIIGRIERLPVEQQRELLALLSKRLQAAER